MSIFYVHSMGNLVLLSRPKTLKPKMMTSLLKKFLRNKGVSPSVNTSLSSPAKTYKPSSGHQRGSKASSHLNQSSQKPVETLGIPLIPCTPQRTWLPYFRNQTQTRSQPKQGSPRLPADQPPVILLHGLISQSYGWLTLIQALIREGYRI